MTTIDKLDIGIYIQYAKRTQMVEEINQQYRLTEATSIPPQTTVVDFIPRPTEIDLLMGVVPLTTPWAYFFPPQRFTYQRRSPFAFFRVAPSLGDLDQQNKDTDMIANTECRTPEEEQEKMMLLACFKQVEKINEWLSHVIGRMGQFLQG